MVSKIQTMRKLNNPTTASLAGHFLTILSFNFNDCIVAKIKKPFNL